MNYLIFFYKKIFYNRFLIKTNTFIIIVLTKNNLIRNIFFPYFLCLGCTFKPKVNKNSEIIDKRNKSVFLQNLNSVDLEFLLKPNTVDEFLHRAKTVDKKKNLTSI